MSKELFPPWAVPVGVTRSWLKERGGSDASRHELFDAIGVRETAGATYAAFFRLLTAQISAAADRGLVDPSRYRSLVSALGGEPNVAADTARSKTSGELSTYARRACGRGSTSFRSHSGKPAPKPTGAALDHRRVRAPIRQCFKAYDGAEASYVNHSHGVGTRTTPETLGLLWDEFVGCPTLTAPDPNGAL